MLFLLSVLANTLEFARIVDFSVRIKVIVRCDGLLDPVNLWAPILWILLLYGSYATVQTTARNGNSL
jgi:hypothetical protein